MAWLSKGVVPGLGLQLNGRTLALHVWGPGLGSQYHRTHKQTKKLVPHQLTEDLFSTNQACLAEVSHMMPKLFWNLLR